MAIRLTSNSPAHLVPLVLVCLGFMLSSSALGQDYFSLFHDGSETKARAGAGVIAAKNAPANYYNPGNLIEEKKGWTPYVALDVLSLNYSYEYPGLEPVSIKTTSPVPFFGVSWRSESDLTVAFSMLPIPAGSGERKIEKLPTLKFASDSESEPVLLDVTTKGEGVGIRSSLGVAYKVMSGLGFGLSIIYGKSSGSTTAKAHNNDENLIIDKTESTSYRVVLGSRASALKGRLNSGFSVNLPSNSSSKGSTKYPALAGDAEAPKKASSKGPMGFGVGVNGLLTDSLVPFFEVHYTDWSALRRQKQDQVLDQAEVDYFSTTDVIVGSDVKISDFKLTLAYGMYQSNLGDGIMKNESDDEKELIGMEFQNLTSVAHNDFAAGFDMPYGAGRIQTGLLYIKGSRDVGNKARGYGHYELSVLSLTAAVSLPL